MDLAQIFLNNQLWIEQKLKTDESSGNSGHSLDVSGDFDS